VLAYVTIWLRGTVVSKAKYKFAPNTGTGMKMIVKTVGWWSFVNIDIKLQVTYKHKIQRLTE